MFNVNEVVKTIKQLIEIRIQILKDEVSDQISTLLTKIVILVLMAFSAIMLLLFASISLAFYLSEVVYSTYMGFLYTALLYLLLFILFFFLKDTQNVKLSLKHSLRKFLFGYRKEDINE